MPTFIAAALCRRRCVSPWHACVVASSDKELRALRRASCDRTQPMCGIVSLLHLPSPPPSVNLRRYARVCDYTRKRDPTFRYIVEFRLLVVVRTSRDQLISAVGNSSRLKRRIHCDVFLQRLVNCSLKTDTRIYGCPFDTIYMNICIEYSVYVLLENVNCIKII